ncbi:uncharacterized protein DUF3592 [Roseimicrobium gellanilyticum]|uniref:Uncharacterized protein DUF3592 n=1 Tax=Roseimicrobium gellanilyticum TaxID=748857 RepID=A0A366HTW8_9BACT|nr:DUF3592 domain-containing protein [Roseimicrobium gellanilyticum]RBP47280.1 uncharacterized protein DUF3592 [Roseimicrobium gellanilyticum]
MDQSISKFFYLLPAAFVLMGAGLTLWALHGQWLALRAQKWPITTGTISKVDEKVSQGRRGNSSVKIKTTYSYEVNGTQYEGTKIHPTYGGNSRLKAHDALKEALQPGRRVQVMYCPENPAQAFLATGFRSGSLAPLVVGVLWMTAGLAFGCLLWITKSGNCDFASLIRPA